MRPHLPITGFIHALAGLFLCAATGAIAAPDEAQLPASRAAVAAEVPAKPLRVAPGRVTFSISPSGRWLGFGPRDGRARISGGGIVVLGSAAGAELRTLLDTRNAGAQVVTTAAELSPAHEGILGGERYPSQRPDDDADGVIDEDRLDGVDNDGDGQVDEDYAAIGDEMVATEYRAGAIEVHQELYAWSLHQIDGLVVTSLTVRNTGREPVQHLRVGAAVDLRKGFTVETQRIGEEDETAEGLSSKGTLISSGNEISALLFFSPVRSSGSPSSWISGVTGSGSDMADLVRTALHVTGAVSEHATTPGATTGPERRVAYAVSPDLGTLVPDAQLTVYVALIAPRSRESAPRSIDYAYRTVIGDGVNRLVPPPVSVTRRIVWGKYELRYPDNTAAGAVVTLYNPRGEGVDPLKIQYLDGIDMDRAIRAELPGGDTRLDILGDANGRFAAGSRVVLRGRLQTGELFDAVLQPDALPASNVAQPAELYFDRPGRLDEALVTGSPNPFRDATTLTYEVPATVVDDDGVEYTLQSSIHTSVKIYNVAGRLISVLSETHLSPGRYEVHWNAHNAVGGQVASGMYYVKLQIGRRFVTKRLTQLK